MVINESNCLPLLVVATKSAGLELLGKVCINRSILMAELEVLVMFLESIEGAMLTSLSRHTRMGSRSTAPIAARSFLAYIFCHIS